MYYLTGIIEVSALGWELPTKWIDASFMGAIEVSTLDWDLPT